MMITKSRAEQFTFKGNSKETRYGWLRLTPAFSIHVVADLLAKVDAEHSRVFDPFCGTGTTALVCAEKGIPCSTVDINPFLLWLTNVKTYRSSPDEVKAFKSGAQAVASVLEQKQEVHNWIPALYQIEKWWSTETLGSLATAMATIKNLEGSLPPHSVNLLKIAFCQTMIEESNASFQHQSMSFKHESNQTLPFTEQKILFTWHNYINKIERSAATTIVQIPDIQLCDARTLDACFTQNSFSHIITSPPYPNRISYIRELRPYMYWLGYLASGKQAAELDWQAIGGTWGSATSKLNTWLPEDDLQIPFDEFPAIIEGINDHSVLLARYVEKYFHDMVKHCQQVFQVLKHDGKIYYIVGNSKFYDQMLPVEAIFAAIFASVGFEDITTDVLRKRSSKKELREFLISARKP